MTDTVAPAKNVMEYIPQSEDQESILTVYRANYRREYFPVETVHGVDASESSIKFRLARLGFITSDPISWIDGKGYAPLQTEDSDLTATMIGIIRGEV